jgi:hypothetical protein
MVGRAQSELGRSDLQAAARHPNALYPVKRDAAGRNAVERFSAHQHSVAWNSADSHQTVAVMMESMMVGT